MMTTTERPAVRSRTKAAILWTLARLPGIPIGVAGMAKFYASARWDQLFASWGYPTWFSKVTGIIEVAGAVLLFVPRTSMYGLAILAATMLGALMTLLAHRGGRFGWGSTPLAYLVWFSVLAIVRARRVGWAGSRDGDRTDDEGRNEKDDLMSQ
jgi:putative oxidoreductase